MSTSDRQDTVAAWLRTWLPAIEPAVDDRERARRLRAGLAQLDQWDRAIGQLHGELLGRLAELDSDEEDAT